MAEELPYALLDRLLGARHKAEVPCPVCSSERKAHHRRSPCFGLARSAADKIVFNCMHCGVNGVRTDGWRGEDRVEPRPYVEQKPEDLGGYARQLWADSVDPRGTDTERYWHYRNLVLPIPPTIRHLPGMMLALAGKPSLWTEGDDLWGPCETVEAVQRTFLKPGGQGKTAKKAAGPIKGLPIVVHCNPESLALVIGEGIENTHALAASLDIDGWAVTGKSFFRAIGPAVPSYVEVVTVIVDPDAGQECHELRRELEQRGLEVVLVETEDGDEANDQEERLGHTG